MKDLKITKGEFTLQNWVKAKGQGEVATELRVSGVPYGALVAEINFDVNNLELSSEKANANGKLIKEAFEVANETGLMPREMADELNETKRRLEECSNLSNKFNMEMRQQNEELSEKLNTSVENLHAQQKNIRELQQQNKELFDALKKVQTAIFMDGQNEEKIDHIATYNLIRKTIKKAEQSV